MAVNSAVDAGAVPVDITAMNPVLEPDGFTFWRTGNGAPAEWRVVTDPTAAYQAAIAQTSTDTTDYRFPLAVYKPVSAKDIDVSVRFKPVSGNVDQAGGIAVRLTTYDDYYVVRANALEDNVRFYRVVKGRRSKSTALIPKWRAISGTRSACALKAALLRSRSTARRSSPRMTRPSPMPARSRCGPRPIA